MNLEAIEKRAEAATEGPWGYVGEMDPAKDSSTVYIQDTNGWDIAELHGFYEKLPANRDFIARARTDIPALCAALRVSEKMLNDWRRLHAEKYARAEKAEARIVELEGLARGLEHDDDCPALEYSSAPCECYLQHWHATLGEKGEAPREP